MSTTKHIDLNTKSSPCYEGEDFTDVEDSEFGRLIYEKFGCTSPYIDQRNRHGASICENQTTGKLVQDFMKTRSGRFGTSMWKKNYFMPPPCTYNTYTFVQNDYYQNDKKYLYLTLQNLKDRKPKSQKTRLLIIYFVSKMEVVEQFWSYTFLQYIAEVGGYVGLFLGYSLLQLGDVIQFVRNKIHFISRK